MVETQTPTAVTAPTPTPHTSEKTLPVAAMILGIISLVVPIIGIVTAILAILFAVVALHRKTPYKNFAVTGIVTGILGIVYGIVVIALITLLITHPPFGNILFPTGGTRTALVNAQAAERKDFKIGETAKIGAMDINITTVERNYAPTAEEIRVIGISALPTEYNRKGSVYDQGTILTDDQVEYVRVAGNMKLNGSEELGGLGYISDIQLNNVLPVLFNGKSTGYNINLSNDPTPINFVYRIKKDSPSLVLKYVDTVYTSISWLVGTEGAPTKRFTYTITLS
jgi:uncharacterized membrane protein